MVAWGAIKTNSRLSRWKTITLDFQLTPNVDDMGDAPVCRDIQTLFSETEYVV